MEGLASAQAAESAQLLSGSSEPVLLLLSTLHWRAICRYTLYICSKRSNRRLLASQILIKLAAAALNLAGGCAAVSKYSSVSPQDHSWTNIAQTSLSPGKCEDFVADDSAESDTSRSLLKL